jgi:hypothetical protein
MLTVDMSPVVGKTFTDEDVGKLEIAFLREEQVDCPLTHHFGPGVYIREVVMPAGACVIGHRQKFPHLNIMAEGRLTLINSDGTYTELVAPQTFIAPAGRKIAYIHETVRWQNVYAANETDVAALETRLLDKSVASQDAQQARTLLIAYDHTADHEDFAKAIEEFGFAPEIVTAISEYEGDQIPMPLGSYKMQIAPSRIHGKGVFATGDIAAHELIAPARINDKRTPVGRFTNHSSKPNAVMFKDDKDDIYLFSTQVLSGCKGGIVGDEITIDYRQALTLSMGAK